MHALKNTYFIGGSVCYLLIQFSRYQDVAIPTFINGYGSDFLFMPLLLFFALWLTRIIKRDATLEFSLLMLSLVFVYVSVVFEYYLPQRSSIYTQDKFDVIMYLLGTIVFAFLQKKTIV